MVGSRRPGSTPAHPFVGRADLWKEIDLLLAEAAGGAGRGVLLGGPSGMGKSEVLRATAGRAGARDFRVAVARALPDEMPAPFSLVRDLVASLAKELEPIPVDEPLPTANLPVLFVPAEERSPPDPRPVDRSAEGSPASDELERILAPIGRTEVEGLGASRDRLHGRLVQHFLGLARDRPLLLAVDDLPFADLSSLQFLWRLSNELASARIALVATMGEEADVPPGVREIVGSIRRSASLRSIALRPLTLPELAEFVTYLHQGVAPLPADVERWYAQTDGNPLFVEQIVRSTLEGGPRDAPTGDGIPDLVTVLLARIRSLDDTERRVLTYAAVLGREFDFARLAAAGGVEEERLSEALDRLVLAGLLREKGEEVYEFVSEALRASVYAELTETRRRILHHRVATALEGRAGTGNFELARQFYLGRDYPKTVEYNLRAAEAATRSFAFDAALSHLARALEAERRRSDHDTRREIRLLTEYGRLLHETGDLVRSEEVLTEAVDLARTEGTHELELGRALLALAWSRLDRGLYSAVEPLAKEAIALLERVGTPRDLLSGHRVLGNVYWRVVDLPQAVVHQRIALEIAEREGTPIERGHALVDMANTLQPQGRESLEVALGMYARAAELFATADDPSARARVLMDRAVFEYGVGMTADAYRDLDEALAAAERSRSPLWIGFCLLNLAEWKAEAGDAPAGAAALERAGEALRPLSDRLARQQIAMIQGMVEEAAGRFEQGEASYRESLEQAREAHLASEASEVLFRLAQLSLRKGDREAARRWLDEASASGVARYRPDFAGRAEALAEALRDPR
ncbi:MAG: ATP-binding protein [Thermoplasmata archaeon]